MFWIFNKAEREKRKIEQNFLSGKTSYYNYLIHHAPNRDISLSDYIEYFLSNLGSFSDSKFSKNYVSNAIKTRVLTEMYIDIISLYDDVGYEKKKKFFEMLLEHIEKDYDSRKNFYKDDEDCKYIFKFKVNKELQHSKEELTEDEKYKESVELYNLFLEDKIKDDYKRYLNFIGKPFINITFQPDWDGIENGEQPYNGSFNIDYNETFVTLLKKAEIEGSDSDEIVDNWFSNVCVMLSVAFIQDANDTDKFKSLMTDDPATTIVENIEINEDDFATYEEYEKAKSIIKDSRVYR